MISDASALNKLEKNFKPLSMHEIITSIPLSCLLEHFLIKRPWFLDDAQE